MVGKICALLLVALFGLSGRVEAQECVADSVQNITLSAYHLLSWEVGEDQPCVITQFLIYIYQRNKPIEYSFEVNGNENEVDVSFLEVCQDWIFNIIPVSNHTRGHEHHFYASVPLPWHADLSIAYINVTRNGVTGDLHLSWDITDARLGSCTIRYRLTIEEDESPDIHDLYLSERSVNMHFLSPCTKYQIGVRAINIAHPTIEGPIRSRYYDFPAAKQIPPRLESVEQGVTTINMTWELEPKQRNRCEVKEFQVYGGTFFNVSAIYDDKPERVHVNLSVDHLKPSSMYYMRASVQNSAGWSDATIAAIQTLDLSPDGQIKKLS
ncbi:hypothetical protein NQ315_001361 [Exocentrus adspersus]|uniref:Fibronectin type-III domain-containing protein n=1 Tax=Exocentrus adspersus TaxID=1586481 RepID=A0AAV8WG16_9CUCU|nr:hypothetical protein NQ315_001361 [Exocentrus adspersus]